MVRKDQTSDVQLHIGEVRPSQMCSCTSEFDASHRPGMTTPRVQMVFFIIFVDAMFTILFGPMFTRVFDVIGKIAASSCVYRPCNAD
jgi:hypothetical protein